MKGNARWIVLIAALVLVSLGAMAAFYLLREEGDVAVVNQDGHIIYRLPLDEDTELTIPAPNGGENTVVIQDGQVSVTYATCPDQICVHHLPIAHTTDTPIACLPNRLSITIQQGGGA